MIHYYYQRLYRAIPEFRTKILKQRIYCSIKVINHNDTAHYRIHLASLITVRLANEQLA